MVSWSGAWPMGFFRRVSDSCLVMVVTFMFLAVLGSRTKCWLSLISLRLTNIIHLIGLLFVTMVEVCFRVKSLIIWDSDICGLGIKRLPMVTRENKIVKATMPEKSEKV